MGAMDTVCEPKANKVCKLSVLKSTCKDRQHVRNMKPHNRYNKKTHMRSSNISKLHVSQHGKHSPHKATRSLSAGSREATENKRFRAYRKRVLEGTPRRQFGFSSRRPPKVSGATGQEKQLGSLRRIPCPRLPAHSPAPARVRVSPPVRGSSILPLRPLSLPGRLAPSALPAPISTVP